jgi:hypothetical protein
MTEPANSIDYWQRRGYTRECPDCGGCGTHEVWTNSMFNPLVTFTCSTCKGEGGVRATSLEN